MCSVLGVALTLVMVVPLCWMVADILLIARFLIQPPPKPKFVAYLYILGWGEPLTAYYLALSFLEAEVNSLSPPSQSCHWCCVAYQWGLWLWCKQIPFLRSSPTQNCE